MRRSLLIFIVFCGLLSLAVSAYAAGGAKTGASALVKPSASALVKPSAPGTLQVESVRYGGAGPQTRIVFDLNRQTDFRAFLLDNPYRVVVDFPRAEWKTFKSQLASGNHIARSYRSGTLDDGLTRVIFDLKGPATIRNAFIVPRTSMTGDRLVVDVEKASLNAFNAQKSRVFGNRSLKSAGAAPKPPVSDYAAGENAQARTAGLQSTAKPLRQPLKGQKTYTIVIDAGHGGDDPGAVSHGVKEKHITLAVARELRRQLEETGRYKVVLTRDRDVYITLRNRVEISRDVKADLFISIHADKIDRNNVRGASIYTLSEKASDTETARLAEEENNAGFVAGVDLSQESQDVADILLDLAMREKMNESGLFARVLSQAFSRKNVRLLPNSHRSAGFAVLKAPDVPSALIETGFLSNPEEAKLLSSGQFQRTAASAIVDGVDAYFRKMQALQKP